MPTHALKALDPRNMGQPQTTRMVRGSRANAYGLVRQFQRLTAR